MTVTVSPEIEQRIHQLVETGRYPDATAVVRDALALLEQRERQLDELRAKIQIGIDEADRGDVIEVTPEFWVELDREVDEMMARGELPDPDVCP